VHDSDVFLRSLTVVLVVAGITTVVCQRLRLPIVLGYIVAGLIVGPHVPVPLIADEGVVHTLSELGVILLMFSLGLEFTIPRLTRVAPTAGIVALFQATILMWLGFVVGQALGWTTMESVFTGAAISISSTIIIAKVFDDQNIGGRLRELVVGVLLMEDLIAIILMAGLTAAATGRGLSPAELAVTLGRLALFLVALMAVGMLLLPRFVRYVARRSSDETILVTSVGICFATAWIAQRFGYSVALGAFVAGSLVAESGRAEKIEHLVKPLKDVFLAVFFVSVGLSINPTLLAQHWPAIAALTPVVVVGTFIAVAMGSFLVGEGARTSVQAGMSLAQIGEFSFIIAGLGVALRVAGDHLYTVLVVVSAITTITTPLLIRAAGPVAAWVDRKLPARLQTYAALYGSWLERLRSSGPGRSASGVPRILRLLVLDAAALSALLIAALVGIPRSEGVIAAWLGLEAWPVRAALIALAAALAVPLVLGIGRLSRRLAEAALPRKESGVDLDLAPRRSLSVTLQLVATVLAVGVVAAATAPFLRGTPVVIGVLAVFAAFGIALWRSADNLEKHVKAGSQAVVSALARYARESKHQSQPMVEIRQLFHGIGDPVAVALQPGSPGVGRSLAELNLRGRTGATVLAISRDGNQVISPSADEVLRGNDLLALAGTAESVESARRVLLDG
jgi:CPA2 family monovalent cation:H+ antiporter-2